MNTHSRTTNLIARKASLESLKTRAVLACERAAGQGRRDRMPPPNPGSWDRSTVRRYLAEAHNQNAVLGPKMRRLRQEIEALESRDAVVARP